MGIELLSDSLGQGVQPDPFGEAGADIDGSTSHDGGLGDEGGSSADGGSQADAALLSCELDRDDDGTADCDDACPDDANKVVQGVCGCGVSEADRDGDGLLDCVDTCGGSDDTRYVADASCGVGYCRTTNTPSACVAGAEVMCKPGSPRSATDTTCDGIDDDCSGAADEEYVPTAQCGVGYCRTTSTASSCSNGAVIACQPGAPLAATDTTFDGVDDDCDGVVDDDACVPHTETYGVGTFTSSPGPCRTVTVRLWGGAGAAGDAQGGYWGATIAGYGGAGGFAQGTFTVTSTSVLQLYVGQGGRGCGGPGTTSVATYNGGTGATSRNGSGTAGADGSVTGGTGGTRGGAGSFGGGGGGAGTGPSYAPFGSGGGGGAASVLLIGSTRMIAGGGGGGAGVGTDITTAGYPGGNGGSGCSGNGTKPSGSGGGGGGGGVCSGGTTSQQGSGRTPYDPNNEISGTVATGGNNNSDCQAGGDGFAVVSYGR